MNKISFWLAVLVLLSCLNIPLEVYAQGFTFRVDDSADESGFQDNFLNHFKRGRTNVAVDFDLDGTLDFYVGNPFDESFILKGTERNGKIRYDVAQVLLSGHISFGGSAADYDNDGDYDLFITGGGKDGADVDYLFKNMLMEEGTFRMEDVTDIAGVKGAVPPGETEPVLAASANSSWVDDDRAGDVDIFVNIRNSES